LSLKGVESLGETDTASWLKTLHVNSIAPLKLTEALAEHVARSKQKKIASITSGMGSMGGHASTGAYAYRSSKAALNMVMVTAANELRSRGISEDEARRLVVLGFLSEIVQKIGEPALEERLSAALEAELGGAE